MTTARRREVFAVVDAAFAQRRKTLRAALAGWAGSAAAAEAALVAAGVSPQARGEALTVEEFARSPSTSDRAERRAAAVPARATCGSPSTGGARP